jgi:RimJ/RimL family protein N-acetyltransferase
MTALLTTPMGIVSIRPAVATDAAQLRELRLESLAAHPEAFAADYVISSAESTRFWSRRVSDYEAQKSGVIYLAATGERLIGMTGLVRGHWPKTRHGGTLWGVYVNHEWRGLGVAEAIIHGCLTWAEEHDLTVVKLAVVTSNTAAIRCYGRCGFSVYGVEPQVIYHNGTYLDELLMARGVDGADRPSATAD